MIFWSPDEELIKSAAITRFKQEVESEEKLTFLNYHFFQHWTADNPEKFWKKVADFTGIKFHFEPTKILENRDAMPGATWFRDATLNYTENLLRFNDDKSAIVSWNEAGFSTALTYRQLRERVSAVRDYFFERGVGKGDVVAGYMPNIPETIIAFLATAALGATWSSSSPDFSVNAVSDRFSQVKPKILVAADGYIYKGKKINILKNIKALLEKIPSIESVLVCPNLNESVNTSELPNASLYSDLEYKRELILEAFEANNPLFILYSSGTTGKPKCIVHSSIGILIEHAKEHALEANIKRDDIVFYNTTCGWMMWNWLVGVLFQGATIILYDGFALHESKGKLTLISMLEEEKVSIFGTSASYIQKIEELGIKAKEKYELKNLKSILSTGSRLKPESFDYVYEAFGKVHLCPIWGGTDLCGCLGLCSPLLPVRRGEIQTRGLGFALDIVDDQCKSLRNSEGEVILRKPFPSMPLYFLNDENGEKYRAAYFEHFPGIWRHGDLAILTDDNGIIVLGRSDDVLNPGGVRIGAAEVTLAAESISEVSEAIAIGQNYKNEERIILFVILKEGAKLTKEVEKQIQDSMPSPRHKPKFIIAVPDFPTTLSGKRSAKTIRDIINGKEAGNKDALANPAVLDFYKNIKELK